MNKKLNLEESIDQINKVFNDEFEIASWDFTPNEEFDYELKNTKIQIIDDNLLLSNEIVNPNVLKDSLIISIGNYEIETTPQIRIIRDEYKKIGLEISLSDDF